MKKVKFLGHFLLICITLVLLAGLVRLCAFDMLTISQQGNTPHLLQGDHVLVNKWAYGWRIPKTSWVGYQRVRARNVQKGDWISFNSPDVEAMALPDTSQLCVGRVLACPGDTVWMGNHGKISAYKDYVRGCIWPLAVPAHGMHVHIAPWAVNLYSITIQRHEGDKTSILNDSLFIGERAIDYYRFHRDYYWISSENEQNFFDSRTFGFVPAEFVVGRIESILYSTDKEKPWYKPLRKRYFKAVE